MVDELGVVLELDKVADGVDEVSAMGQERL